jgi:predicted nucleic acid-binding protein
VIFVDSSVWIDYFRGVPTKETELLDELLGVEPIVIGDIVLAEVLQGFKSDRDFNQAKRLMTSLIMVDMLGHEMAIQAARNFRSLRVRGITVRKTIDTIIATYCIENDLALLHSDRDFDAFVEHLNLRSALTRI